VAVAILPPNREEKESQPKISQVEEPLTINTRKTLQSSPFYKSPPWVIDEHPQDRCKAFHRNSQCIRRSPFEPQLWKKQSRRQATAGWAPGPLSWCLTAWLLPTILCLFTSSHLERWCLSIPMTFSSVTLLLSNHKVRPRVLPITTFHITAAQWALRCFWVQCWAQLCYLVSLGVSWTVSGSYGVFLPVSGPLCLLILVACQ
jgi:hypothetical protein